MSFLNWIILQFHLFYDWYRGGGEGPFRLWLFGGAIVFQAFLIISYFLIRWLLGYRKFRGTWYDEKLWNELINLADDKKHGNGRSKERDEHAA